MNADQRGLLIYMAKCSVGCLTVFGLADWFQLPELGWLLISLVLVLSPDGKDALQLAVSRILANIAAAVASLLVLTLHLPDVGTIALGFVITLLICYVCRIMSGSRSALAGVVVIALHEEGPFTGYTALERAFFVISGCALGLIITMIFHRQWLGPTWPKRSAAEAPKPTE